MAHPMSYDALHLDGKVVVVTGAANGIGATTSDVLIGRGATVERLDVVAGEGVVACDVTDEDRVAEVIADVVTRHGRIDAIAYLISDAARSVSGATLVIDRGTSSS